MRNKLELREVPKAQYKNTIKYYYIRLFKFKCTIEGFLESNTKSDDLISLYRLTFQCLAVVEAAVDVAAVVEVVAAVVRNFLVVSHF